MLVYIFINRFFFFFLIMKNIFNIMLMQILWNLAFIWWPKVFDDGAVYFSIVSSNLIMIIIIIMKNMCNLYEEYLYKQYIYLPENIINKDYYCQIMVYTCAYRPILSFQFLISSFSSSLHWLHCSKRAPIESQ